MPGAIVGDSTVEEGERGMTVTTDRPHMTIEEFEHLARIAAREAEGLRLEFIGGVLRSKAMPDGDHGRIILWLTRICMQHHPEFWLHPGQGIKAERYREGRAIPDGVLAHEDAFVGQGDWVDPSPILMAVEVTSWDSDTERRDRIEKPRAYRADRYPRVPAHRPAQVPGSRPQRPGWRPLRDRPHRSLRQGS